MGSNAGHLSARFLHPLSQLQMSTMDTSKPLTGQSLKSKSTHFQSPEIHQQPESKQIYYHHHHCPLSLSAQTMLFTSTSENLLLKYSGVFIQKSMVQPAHLCTKSENPDFIHSPLIITPKRGKSSKLSLDIIN